VSSHFVVPILPVKCSVFLCWLPPIMSLPRTIRDQYHLPKLSPDFAVEFPAWVFTRLIKAKAIPLPGVANINLRDL